MMTCLFPNLCRTELSVCGIIYDAVYSIKKTVDCGVVVAGKYDVPVVIVRSATLDEIGEVFILDSEVEE